MTRRRPLLSIVVPTHSTAELTLRCLRSIEAQRNAVDEVVVVDDASQDDTVERVLVAHPGVVVLRQERCTGFTQAANRGLAEASGDILLLLNSDTELPPESLAALRDAFSRDSRMGVAGGRLHYPDGTPQWSGGGEPGPFWAFAVASGLPAVLARLPGYRRLRPVSGAEGGLVDWVTGAAMACRRATWEEVGPLEEEFEFYCQDLDFCLRAGAAGWDVRILSDFEVMHVHGATIDRVRDGGGATNPRLLWSDLVRWAAKAKGERGARRFRRALLLGGRLRSLALRIERARGSSEAATRERAVREAVRSLRALSLEGKAHGSRNPLVDSSPDSS